MIERYDPVGRATSLDLMLDRLLADAFASPGQGEMTTQGGAELDIYEEGDNLVVEARLPGVRPEDVDVSVDGDTLTIRAETKLDEERKERNYLLRESRRGVFLNRVRLPDTVDTERAQASFEDGVLRLTFPKSDRARSRRIPIAPGSGRVIEGQASERPRETRTSGGSLVREGMEVVGSDGEKIGRVKEIREGDFLVDRRLDRDVYVPFDAVDHVEDGRVMLTIPAGRLDDMDWPHPPILSSEPSPAR